MIALHTALKFLIGHVLAGATVILGTLLVTCGCYVIGVAREPHGIDTPMAEIPFFLTLIFTAGCVAVIASTGSFLISVPLTCLRSKRRFPAWLPVIVVPLLTFAMVFLIYGRANGIEFVTMVTGAVFVYFGIYWMLLISSAAVLDYLRNKWRGPKA